VGNGRREQLLLAAIHGWAVNRVPRLIRLRPLDAAPGDVVLLEGDGLDGHDVRAHFGPVETWAVAVSPRVAVAVVPAAASGPLGVSVSRQGLRSNTVAWEGPPGESGARVVRVAPADGAARMFADDPVIVTLSHPADVRSIDSETFRVADEAGPVPGRVRPSPDARVLVWSPERPLRAGRHTVTLAGLRDLRGREMAAHVSQFTAGRYVARSPLPEGVAVV
jgi:hypothetical protein